MSAPATLMPYQCWLSGASDTRPRWGLSPNRPQLAAGMRIEPAPSVAWAMPHQPGRHGRAALPPLEPPGVRSGSQGLRVTPQLGDSVCADDGQLGQVGLADDHRAGRAQAADELGVLGAPGSP